MQQIHFTGDLRRAEGSSMFFIIEERNSLRFFQKEQLKYYDLFCFNVTF